MRTVAAIRTSPEYQECARMRLTLGLFPRVRATCASLCFSLPVMIRAQMSNMHIPDIPGSEINTGGERWMLNPPWKPADSHLSARNNHPFLTRFHTSGQQHSRTVLSPPWAQGRLISTFLTFLINPGISHREERI